MREKILEILTIARDNGISKETVYKKLGYTNLSYEDFEEVFDDMENSHQIYRTGKNSFTKNPFYEGIVTVTKKGDILVKCDEGTINITRDDFSCVSGDKVIVRITDFNEKKGTIKSVVDRKKIVAEVKTIKNKRYAITKDGTQYKIDLKPNIVDGAIIGIKIDKNRKNKEPIAIFDKFIGHINDPVENTDKEILYENGFDYEWPKEVLEEVKQLPSEVLPEDLKGRKDLRNEVIFTIDGDDTKDIDDAISISKKENGNYILGVHIADVTHYVKEGSEIDKEATARGTSVYMHRIVNPMHPIELANGICSLNPEKDRLAMSCEIEISPAGKVIDFDIFESVIHSRKQMTYKNVNKILEENIIPEGYEPYEETLKEMQNLAEILRKSRIKRGYQDFDLPEVKIVTDENYVPIEIKAREQGLGEKLIEMFMLAANEVVGTYIYSLGLAATYRDHDIPDETKLKKVISIAKNYGEKMEIKGKVGSSKFVQDLLKELKNSERKEVLTNLVLRSMAKATYEAYNIGHFGIGVDKQRGEAYVHFTSPIRRRPDCEIHRILKEIIHGHTEELYSEKQKEKIVEIAKHSSIQEQNADKCERESNKEKMAEYMQQFIDEEFEGMIFGFTTSGMFIQLSNLVEGRVAYSTMDDYYNYDEENELLIGEKNKKIYRLGDKVVIKVVKSDPQLREIDFEIVKPKVRKLV